MKDNEEKNKIDINYSCLKLLYYKLQYVLAIYNTSTNSNIITNTQEKNKFVSIVKNKIFMPERLNNLIEKIIDNNNNSDEIVLINYKNLSQVDVDVKIKLFMIFNLIQIDIKNIYLNFINAKDIFYVYKYNNCNILTNTNEDTNIINIFSINSQLPYIKKRINILKSMLTNSNYIVIKNMFDKILKLEDTISIKNSISCNYKELNMFIEKYINCNNLIQNTFNINNIFVNIFKSLKEVNQLNYNEYLIENILNIIKSINFNISNKNIHTAQKIDKKYSHETSKLESKNTSNKNIKFKYNLYNTISCKTKTIKSLKSYPYKNNLYNNINNSNYIRDFVLKYKLFNILKKNMIFIIKEKVTLDKNAINQITAINFYNNNLKNKSFYLLYKNIIDNKKVYKIHDKLTHSNVKYLLYKFIETMKLLHSKKILFRNKLQTINNYKKKKLIKIIKLNTIKCIQQKNLMFNKMSLNKYSCMFMSHICNTYISIVSKSFSINNNKFLQNNYEIITDKSKSLIYSKKDIFNTLKSITNISVNSNIIAIYKIIYIRTYNKIIQNYHLKKKIKIYIYSINKLKLNITLHLKKSFFKKIIINKNKDNKMLLYKCKFEKFIYNKFICKFLNYFQPINKRNKIISNNICNKTSLIYINKIFIIWHINILNKQYKLFFYYLKKSVIKTLCKEEIKYIVKKHYMKICLNCIIIKYNYNKHNSIINNNYKNNYVNKYSAYKNKIIRIYFCKLIKKLKFYLIINFKLFEFQLTKINKTFKKLKKSVLLFKTKNSYFLNIFYRSFFNKIEYFKELKKNKTVNLNKNNKNIINFYKYFSIYLNIRCKLYKKYLYRVLISNAKLCNKLSLILYQVKNYYLYYTTKKYFNLIKQNNKQFLNYLNVKKLYKIYCLKSHINILVECYTKKTNKFIAIIEDPEELDSEISINLNENNSLKHSKIELKNSINNINKITNKDYFLNTKINNFNKS